MSCQGGHMGSNFATRGNISLLISRSTRTSWADGVFTEAKLANNFVSQKETESGGLTHDHIKTFTVKFKQQKGQTPGLEVWKRHKNTKHNMGVSPCSMVTGFHDAHWGH